MGDLKKKLPDIAGEAAGAAVSAGIGMSVAGPVGAIVGASIGAVISSISADFFSRLLSQKEKERIDQVNKVAVAKIKENEKAGKILRGEEFFSNATNDRSTAEEIYEGVLIAAQKEYEEKKILLLGRLYANIAFDSSITRPIANALIKEASDLTYQQLKIIKVVGLLAVPASQGVDPRRKNTSNSVSGMTNVAIATDILTLYHKTMVHSSSVIFDAAGVDPSLLTLVGHGVSLFKLMELEKSEVDNIEIDIVRFLTSSNEH